jgi:uncharacterized lipoprotein YbaY
VPDEVSGTLTYAESHELSADAYAAVAIVRGSKADASAIIASEIYHDIGQVPVDFAVSVDPDDVDPDATYTLQATIVDGENAWVTGHGIPVLTDGNPSEDVKVTLAYRPDLLKGAVSGQVTAIGLTPAPTAYVMTVLVDPNNGDSLGMDVGLVDTGLPAPFSIPFAIPDIEKTNDYVVTAQVTDGTDYWRNAAGVPVITKGNPKAGVQVVVTEVAAPAPTPGQTPIPTAAPAEPGRGDGQGGLLGLIILITLIAAAVVFLVAWGRRDQETVPEPTTTEPGAGAPPSDEPPAPTDTEGTPPEA